jgi:hypothetical protein
MLLSSSKSAFSFRKAVEGVVKILIYIGAAHTNGGGFMLNITIDRFLIYLYSNFPAKYPNKN